jgi:hypothetical protein
MPMPNPNKGEMMDDFISRFISDPVMIKDYPDEKQRSAVAHKQWQEKMKPKMFEIDNVEIFEVGNWNGDTYSESDLDNIIKAFSDLNGTIKPYVKLGHDDNQMLLQKDGLPAAGWIKELKRNGGKLLAKFSEVPEKIYELLKRKAYNRVSSEIFWNLKKDNKNYPRVLKAVALLGGDTPAVTSLNDILSLYTEALNFEIIKTYDKKESDDMEIKEYTDQINTLTEEVKKYEMDLEKEKSEKTSLQEKLNTIEKEKVVEYIENKMKEGKLLPAQKDHFLSLATFSFDTVKNILDNAPKLPEFSEDSEKGKVKEKKYSEMNEEEKDNEITKRAEKYSLDNKISFSEALKIVAKEV